MKEVKPTHAPRMNNKNALKIHGVFITADMEGNRFSEC